MNIINAIVLAIANIIVTVESYWLNLLISLSPKRLLSLALVTALKETELKIDGKKYKYVLQHLDE